MPCQACVGNIFFFIVKKIQLERRQCSRSALPKLWSLQKLNSSCRKPIFCMKNRLEFICWKHYCRSLALIFYDKWTYLYRYRLDDDELWAKCHVKTYITWEREEIMNCCDHSWKRPNEIIFLSELQYNHSVVGECINQTCTEKREIDLPFQISIVVSRKITSLSSHKMYSNQN